MQFRADTWTCVATMVCDTISEMHEDSHYFWKVEPYMFCNGFIENITVSDTGFREHLFETKVEKLRYDLQNLSEQNDLVISALRESLAKATEEIASFKEEKKGLEDT